MKTTSPSVEWERLEQIEGINVDENVNIFKVKHRYESKLC